MLSLVRNSVQHTALRHLPTTALHRGMEQSGWGLVVGVAAATLHTTSTESLAESALAYNAPGRWQLHGAIGAGSYGTVRLGQCINSGETAAVKVVEYTRQHRSALEREISSLQLIKALGGHPNIVELRDIYVDNRRVCLVTELVAGGELFEHIISKGVFPETRVRSIAPQLAGALQFLHKHGVIHNDIKPENVLLSTALTSDSDDNEVAKLADFGSAGPTNKFAKDRDEDEIGTVAYLSPELLTTKCFTPASDMWALGCVLYIALCGAHPFDLEGTASDTEVERRIREEEIDFGFAPWQLVSDDAKDVVRRLLAKDPTVRMTADELLEHPWLTKTNLTTMYTSTSTTTVVDRVY